MRLSIPTAAIAFSLALGAGLGPALAQNVPNLHSRYPYYEWTGENLRFTPSTVAGCTVRLDRAFKRRGYIFIMMSGTFEQIGWKVTLETTVRGADGASETSVGTFNVSPRLSNEIQVMAVAGGSHSGSTLLIRATGCTS